MWGLYLYRERPSGASLDGPVCEGHVFTGLRKTQSRGTGGKGGENTQERQLRLHCDSLSSPDYTAGHEGTNQLPLVLIAVSRPRQRAVLI